MCGTKCTRNLSSSFSTTLFCYLFVCIAKYRPYPHVLASFLRILPEFFFKMILYLLRPGANRSRYDNYVQSVYKYHVQSWPVQFFNSLHLRIFQRLSMYAVRFLLRLDLPYDHSHKTKLEVISSECLMQWPNIPNRIFLARILWKIFGRLP